MPEDREATYIRIPLDIKSALMSEARRQRRPLSAQIVVLLEAWYQKEHEVAAVA